MRIVQDLYNQILTNIPVACVDAVIIEDGAALLVKRKDKPVQGEWWVPGGRIVKNEMMRDTVYRKTIEEVGLMCSVGPIIYTAETIFPDGPNDIPVHTINTVFLLHVHHSSRTAIKLDSHHSDFRWVKKIDENLHPYIKECFKRAGLS